jgi:transposase
MEYPNLVLLRATAGEMCRTWSRLVEYIPWSDGKRPVTCAMMGFLARWARRLSWRETARAFQTSWEAVDRSVEWFVEWGLAVIFRGNWR